jgi:hypothetical protein
VNFTRTRVNRALMGGAAGNRLRLGAAALLSMILVALVAPVRAPAHDTNSRTAGGNSGVGVTSGPLCDDGSSSGGVTLYGSRCADDGKPTYSRQDRQT